MQFVITANDGSDNEALKRRMAAREDHLNNMRKLKASGNYLMGGARLDDSGKMIGSTVIIDFPNRADVDRWLADEPYVKANVWQKIDIQVFCKAQLE